MYSQVWEVCVDESVPEGPGLLKEFVDLNKERGVRS